MRDDPYACWAKHGEAIVHSPAPDRAGEFRSPEGLARVVVLLLWPLVVLYLLDMLLVPARVFFPKSLAGSSGVYLVQQGAIAVVTVLVAIWFILWMHRCHRNLVALRARKIECSSAATIWAWFVPIVNLYGPYQVMQEIWRGSDPVTVRRQGLSRKIPEGNSTLIRYWWGLWVATLLLDFDKLMLFVQAVEPIDFVRQRLQRLELPEAVAGILSEMAPALVWGHALTWLLSPLCAVLAIVVVKQVTENQERRNVIVERAQREEAAAAQAALEDPGELEVILDGSPKPYLDE